MDTKTVTKKLEIFGLSPVEALIYVYLVLNPAKTIVEIARGINLPRTTVYDHSSKLQKRGLVEEIVGYKTHKLRAQPVTMLEQMIDKEKMRLETLSKEFTDLQKVLVSPGLLSDTSTEVRYYHGAEGFRQMMWRALEATTGHIGYSELGRSVIVGAKTMDRWFEEVMNRKITDRVIINPTEKTLEYMRRQEESDFRKLYQSTRVIALNTLPISGDTTIYNNTFSVAYWKRGEVVGVEIENHELVKTQKAIFEILWKQAKPLSKLRTKN